MAIPTRLAMAMTPGSWLRRPYADVSAARRIAKNTNGKTSRRREIRLVPQMHAANAAPAHMTRDAQAEDGLSKGPNPRSMKPPATPLTEATAKPYGNLGYLCGDDTTLRSAVISRGQECARGRAPSPRASFVTRRTQIERGSLACHQPDSEKSKKQRNHNPGKGHEEGLLLLSLNEIGAIPKCPALVLVGTPAWRAGFDGLFLLGILMFRTPLNLYVVHGRISACRHSRGDASTRHSWKRPAKQDARIGAHKASSLVRSAQINVCMRSRVTQVECPARERDRKNVR